MGATTVRKNNKNKKKRKSKSIANAHQHGPCRTSKSKTAFQCSKRFFRSPHAARQLLSMAHGFQRWRESRSVCAQCCSGRCKMPSVQSILTSGLTKQCFAPPNIIVPPLPRRHSSNLTHTLSAHMNSQLSTVKHGACLVVCVAAQGPPGLHRIDSLRIC